MKHIQSRLNFIKENFEETEQQEEFNPIEPYATGKAMEGLIVVDGSKDRKNNPLYYVWMEYPKMKVGGKGMGAVDPNNPNPEKPKLTPEFEYEFYTDNNGFKYLVQSQANTLKDEDCKKLLSRVNWAIVRNVDKIVEGEQDKYDAWVESKK